MCVQVKDNANKRISEYSNLLWFCDDCIGIAKERLNLTTVIQNMEKKIEVMFEKTKKYVDTVVAARESGGEKKWSDVVKRRNPPLIIKPKNSSQNSDATKTTVAQKIDPTEIAVAVKNVKKASQGSIIIECENDESLKKLHSAAVSELAAEYVVRIPEPRKPRVIIVGV